MKIKMTTLKIFAAAFTQDIEADGDPRTVVSKAAERFKPDELIMVGYSTRYVVDGGDECHPSVQGSGWPEPFAEHVGPARSAEIFAEYAHDGHHEKVKLEEFEVADETSKQKAKVYVILDLDNLTQHELIEVKLTEEAAQARVDELNYQKNRNGDSASWIWDAREA